jgi:outer membrane beta-barrel protein
MKHRFAPGWIPHACRTGMVAGALALAARVPVARAQDTASDSAAVLPVPVASATTDSAAAPPAPPAYGAPLTTTRKVRLDRAAKNVVRSGPGDDDAIVGVYPKGTTFPVIAKRGPWYGVRVSDTRTGWIHESLCHEFDDLADLEYQPNPRRFVRTGTFLLSGYAGAYAFDRKSNSLVLGGHLGYYVFDRLQFEGGVSWTHVNRPAEIVESLFDLSLEAEDFHMLFYTLNLTYELLPGRQMVPYVTGGGGASIMQGDTETSFNFGAGTTLFLSRRQAMRWEVRDYVFRFGTGASRVTNHNVEFALGTQLLF